MLCPWLLENFAIAQHRNTLHYAITHGGGFRPWI